MHKLDIENVPVRLPGVVLGRVANPLHEVLGENAAALVADSLGQQLLDLVRVVGSVGSFHRANQRAPILGRGALPADNQMRVAKGAKASHILARGCLMHKGTGAFARRSRQPYPYDFRLSLFAALHARASVGSKLVPSRAAKSSL